MSFSILYVWQAKLLIVAWVYGLCAMFFVLMTKRDLLASRSSELFYAFTDIAAAIAIMMVMAMQLAAIGIGNFIVSILK